MTEDFASEFGSKLTQPGSFTLGEAGVVAPERGMRRALALKVDDGTSR